LKGSPALRSRFSSANSPAMLRDNIVIVLVGPQGSLNIGSTARSMLNFGFTELRLVAPEADHYNDDARRMAVKGKVILERATIHDDLLSALADCRYSYATTRRFGKYREHLLHPDQAATELEALASPVFSRERENPYPYESVQKNEVMITGWKPLWEALLSDLSSGVDRGLIAARFHHGLSRAVAETAAELCRRKGVEMVTLSGGVFQNRLLLEEVSHLLRSKKLKVISPEKIPTSDGGLSLGQAVIAAAQCPSL